MTSSRFTVASSWGRWVVRSRNS